MLRYLLAAILITIPTSVQAHPGHDYHRDGQCKTIGNDTGTPCSLVSTNSNFVIVDGDNTWKYTEQINMLFGIYYSVEMNGELVGNDICWKSPQGIHCRNFSFVHGN